MDQSNSEDLINVGRYVIVQRQKYMKLHKFSNLNSNATLGKDQIELAAINNCKYFTTFKMIPKSKGKRVYTLEVAETAEDTLANLNIEKSGADNRNIIDDGKSQKLTTEQIITLRDSSQSSTDILETLISNSNTFHSKTEYSQEKYVKKKQKKYFEYITVKKPSIRLIAEIMYRQEPTKVLNVRPDTLSQLLTYANINGGENTVLYDSGSSGLLAAAVLNSIGANTKGKLIHMHPGNSAQKQALLAMNFNTEQLSRCISVNLYSVLRHFYQNFSSSNEISIESNDNENIFKRKRKLSDVIDETENGNKKQLIATDIESSEINNEGDTVEKRYPDPIWVLENEKACQVLHDKVDSLIIASKEHPLSIFKGLLPFVKGSKPFVIFNYYQEPIQDCYISLRKMANVTCLKMVSSWTREYQVLENRTHPDVLMQGNSGYILIGWIVQ